MNASLLSNKLLHQWKSKAREVIIYAINFSNPNESINGAIYLTVKGMPIRDIETFYLDMLREIDSGHSMHFCNNEIIMKTLLDNDRDALETYKIYNYLRLISTCC